MRSSRASAARAINCRKKMGEVLHTTVMPWGDLLVMKFLCCSYPCIFYSSGASDTRPSTQKIVMFRQVDVAGAHVNEWRSWGRDQKNEFKTAAIVNGGSTPVYRSALGTRQSSSAGHLKPGMEGHVGDQRDSLIWIEDPVKH